MSRLGDQRVEAIVLAVVKALKACPGVNVRDEGRAARLISERLSAAYQSDPELDRAVRSRIRSLSRTVVEGSSEWDILYRQYKEELSRRR
ncbi:MAG: DUF507 family protein [Candidatus Binatia bacterium]